MVSSENKSWVQRVRWMSLAIPLAHPNNSEKVCKSFAESSNLTFKQILSLLHAGSPYSLMTHLRKISSSLRCMHGLASKKGQGFMGELHGLHQLKNLLVESTRSLGIWLPSFLHLRPKIPCWVFWLVVEPTHLKNIWNHHLAYWVLHCCVPNTLLPTIILHTLLGPKIPFGNIWATETNPLTFHEILVGKYGSLFHGLWNSPGVQLISITPMPMW